MINTGEKQNYTSPRVKTVEISALAIICTSTPGLSEDEEYVL